MSRRAGQPVERASRLEAHRNRGAARQVDDLLQPRTTRALRHQDAIERTAGAEGFGYRVNTAKNRHYCSGKIARALLNRLVKFAIAATIVNSTICSSLKCAFSPSRVAVALAVFVTSRA